MWKNRFFYLVLLVYGTILAILYNVYSTGLAAVLLWLLPLVLFLLGAGYISIKITPLWIEELAEQGAVLETGFLIENKSFLPGFLGRGRIKVRSGFGGSCYRVKKTVLLKGRCQTEVNIPVEAVHCGRLEILYQDFRIYDYMRLWSLRKKVKTVQIVRVLPKLIELTGDYRPFRETAEEEEERFSETKSGDDVSEVFGFHEYRPGDRLRGIHWKLSSKREELIVKEYSLPLTTATGIWFDFWKNPSSEAEADELDKALTALFSLSAGLLERKWSHYVYFGGNRFLIETEETITLVLDEIYERGFVRKEELLENAVPNLFYIGQEKDREKLFKRLERESFLWMVNTERIEGILEDIYETDTI